MKKQIIVWVVVAGSILFLGYGIIFRFVAQNQSATNTNRMQVTASFYPLAHIAEQIGGEYVSVLNLTPPGSEPHDFDPSPKDIATLQASNIFIYNGAGLEPWAASVIPELQEKGVQVVEASKELELIGSDPHVWLDPVLVQEEVNSIASAFVALDPAHAPAYMASAQAYTKELQSLHREFTEGLKTCKRRDIVTSHAALAYLAKRYILNMTPISGISPEEEPAPSRLAEIAKFVQANGVTHIFFETLLSPKLAETIASETGAQTIAFNPLEGLSDEEIAQGKTYISVQRENLQALRTALDCI